MARFCLRVASAALLLLLALPLGIASDRTDAAVPIEAGADSLVIQAPPVYYDYRNHSEIKAALYGIETSHPLISKVYDIGDSWEKTQGLADRDIIALKVSDKVSGDEDEPEVMIVGLHHAREWPTSEIVLEIAKNLTDNYGNDSRISWLVDNREIWIVPLVNPDGLDYALQYDEWWRKNRRLNYDGTYGVDLNRNYAGSMNGDPEGAWGGAGSSHDPSSEVYCGEFPFSEPETQAIRDLVLARDFEIALDFHSYGELVMWPWGYTTEVTPDDADLVRIGNELAALNGYTAEQSVGLYPTTGDSIDWHYGGADIYAFCFEVGREFHPDWTSDVLAIIAENIPPALLGIEIAGDREERAFDISHEAVPLRNYTAIGIALNATVTADRGVDTSSVRLHFSVDGGAWSVLSMSLSSGNDTYFGRLPELPVGSIVEYYFVASDLAEAERMAPLYAPYEVFSFMVTEEGPASPVEVTFSPPSEIDGSVSNTVAAHAHNVTADMELLLHLVNASSGYTLDVAMEHIAGDDFSGVLPAGIPLGESDLWLTVEELGIEIWSSAPSLLMVSDQTAPAFSAHDAVQLDQTTVVFTVNCSDTYGVVLVVLTYREVGGGPAQSVDMVLAEGTSTDGMWSVTVTIGGSDPVEYSYRAHDNVQSADLPETGSFLFTPVEIPEFSLVLLVVAVTALSVAMLSRARRP